jgi:protein arginine kinase activator
MDIREKKDGECRYCRCTFSDFKATGMLGCPACYDEFREDIDAILVQTHGSSEHRGKRRAARPDGAPGDADVKHLASELSDAVRREEYEVAALLRDKIRRQTGTVPHTP